MDYKEEDNDQPKKKYGRKEFKQDVAEAVVEARPKRKKRKKVPKAPKPEEMLLKPKLKGNYAAMSVKELRTLLNGKKKALLIKSGFPDGLVPRSKVAMISLCKKLKRKRW